MMQVLHTPFQSFNVPFSTSSPNLENTKYSQKNYEWDHLDNPRLNLRSPMFTTAQNNRHKNRYPDILPFESNRVTLSKSQYINASKIPVSNKTFISCQAPLPQTFNDFWSMIWENRTPVIVMLTKLIEGKKIKAHCYWPTTLGHTETFGEINVTLESCEVNDKMTKRIFSVSKIGDSSDAFKVLHIHYVDWPDFGVPENPKGILKLIDEIESNVYDVTAPVVIHCSAGIGRTGTLLAIISYQEHKRNSQPESVQEIVNHLRKYRMGMVQTFEQYNFIYSVVEML